MQRHLQDVAGLARGDQDVLRGRFVRRVPGARLVQRVIGRATEPISDLGFRGSDGRSQLSRPAPRGSVAAEPSPVGHSSPRGTHQDLGRLVPSRGFLLGMLGAGQRHPSRNPGRSGPTRDPLSSVHSGRRFFRRGHVHGPTRGRAVARSAGSVPAPYRRETPPTVRVPVPPAR